MTRKQWKLSYSAIRAFKGCPMAFRLGYVEGIRQIEDTEAQRMGTNWHDCQLVAALRVDDPCLCSYKSTDKLADPNCPLCGGVGSITEPDPLIRVTAWLDAKYAKAPASIEVESWEIEKTILAYSMAGWLWYYQNDPLESVASELAFNLPVRNPATGRALPNVSWVGKIDRIVTREGRPPMPVEFKSTSKSIDSGSVFWDRMRLDSQGDGYLAAGRQLQVDGVLLQLGMLPPMSGVLYDAWRRPAIKPKKLSQADTKKFLEDKEYCGTTFGVSVIKQTAPEIAKHIEVDSRSVEITLGAAPKPKKDGSVAPTPFAIRETPAMFGARLLQDITEDPGKYFKREELAKTDQDVEKFTWQMYHIYKSMRDMDKAGHWFTNENQCEATYRCPYTSICAHNVDVFDGETTPDGFRRIFKEKK